MDPLAPLLGKYFIERRDVKAVQNRDGTYQPERTKFKASDVADHLSGARTLGHYLLAPGDTTRVIAFDIDLVKEVVPDPDGGEYSPRATWALNPERRPPLTRQLQLLACGLAMRLARQNEGLKVAILYSGNKGLHVYGLPGESIPAEIAVNAAHAVMRSFAWEPIRGNHFWRDANWPAIEVETFPKQTSLDGKDLGNLMRLPLGINRKSNEKSMFLRVGPPPTEFHEMDPTEALTGNGVPWATIS